MTYTQSQLVQVALIGRELEADLAALDAELRAAATLSEVEAASARMREHSLRMLAHARIVLDVTEAMGVSTGAHRRHIARMEALLDDEPPPPSPRSEADTELIKAALRAAEEAG